MASFIPTEDKKKGGSPVRRLTRGCAHVVLKDHRLLGSSLGKGRDRLYKARNSGGRIARRTKDRNLGLEGKLKA